jgi:hypothetical protein
LVSQKASITKNLIFSVITSLTIITGEINAYRMAINSIYYATALIQYGKMTYKNSMLTIERALHPLLCCSGRECRAPVIPALSH